VWNEPNLDHFWVPKANAEQYAQLALDTIAAIRSTAPTALIAAPAVAGFDWPFLRALGESGLFTQIDAVTVHSYGVRTPEDLTQPLLELRALLSRYSPNWYVPVLSGEWGFASTEGGYNEGQQGEFLARQWLVNLAHDINVSIWYDWRDDGTDPRDPEHNFGTVRNDYSTKPAYLAARTLANALSGYRYLRQIPLERDDDYMMLFQSGSKAGVALWTTGSPHTIILPISVDEVEAVTMTGSQRVLPSEGEGLAVSISGGPQYLLFRPDQAPAYLLGWRPARTVNTLRRDQSEIWITFAETPALPLYGEAQVWSTKGLLGSARVDVRPMDQGQVRIPIDLGGLRGNIRAEVRLILDTPAMTDLQTARIWIQVAPSSGATD
jgi:hypothetical protein